MQKINYTVILPVHKSLEISYYSYLDVKFPNQGIRSFNKNIKTEIIEMVNGYDTEKWQNKNSSFINHLEVFVVFRITVCGNNV